MITPHDLRKWNTAKSTVNLILDGNLGSIGNLKILTELWRTLTMRVRMLRKGKTLRFIIAEEDK